MQSHRVVPAFDKGEADDLRLGLRRKAATFQQLAFEGREEALAHRIVVGVADRSHRRPHTGTSGPMKWSPQEDSNSPFRVRSPDARSAGGGNWSRLPVLPRLPRIESPRS